MLAAKVVVNSGSNHASPNPSSNNQDLDIHRALIMKGLKDLTFTILECERKYHTVPKFRESIRIHDYSRLIETSEILRSSLLPVLRHQVTCLSQSLERSAVLKDSTRSNKSVSYNLVELKRLLDEIHSRATQSQRRLENNRRKFSALSDSNCIYLIHKIDDVRIHLLDVVIPNWLGQMEEIHSQSKDTIKRFEGLISLKQSAPSQPTDVLTFTNQLNEWLEISELQTVREYWQIVKVSINQLFRSLADMVRGPNSTENDFEYPTERARGLGQSALTIFKLFRLLFDKLLKATAIKGSPRLDSYNLKEIMGITPVLAVGLEEFVYYYDELDSREIPDLCEYVRRFVKPAQFLINIFESCLVSASFESNDSCHYSEIKSWVKTWNQQFTMVTQRFIGACTVVQQPVV